MQQQRGSVKNKIETNWIGDPEHPTFQAVLFALEQNAYAISSNQLIVQTVNRSTQDLIELIKETLKKEGEGAHMLSH